MEGEPKRKRSIVIQQYTLTDLADIYCVTKYIMRNMIKRIKKELGKRIGYYFSIEQVEKIFNLIKLPSNVEIFKS